jgi:hypothetical protein
MFKDSIDNSHGNSEKISQKVRTSNFQFGQKSFAGPFNHGSVQNHWIHV